MQIRLSGTCDEIAALVPILKDVLDVVHLSEVFTGDKNWKDCRIYIDIKPSPMWNLIIPTPDNSIDEISKTT